MNFRLQMEKGQILVSTEGIFFAVLMSLCVLKKLIYGSLTQATEKYLELTTHKHRYQYNRLPGKIKECNGLVQNLRFACCGQSNDIIIQ